MEENEKLPHFSRAYLESLKIDYNVLGLNAVLPWKFFLLLILPSLVVYFVQPDFVFMFNPSQMPPMLGGCMVAVGMMGALTVNLMGQIINTANDKEFSKYLNETGTFSVVIFFPQYTFFMIFLALLICLATIFLFSFSILSSVLPYLFFVSIGAVIYAVTNVWSLIDLSRTLAWHRRDYVTLLEEQIAELKAEIDAGKMKK